MRHGSIAEIESSTIANNEASEFAGGAINAATLTVSNSIFWNNTVNDELSQIFTHPFKTTSTIVRFSDIDGGHDGVGNIDEDPMFWNEQADDYRLRSSSPAIDAGTNAGASGFDLDGRPKPLDADRDSMFIVDMGAFERDPAQPF